VERVDHQRPLQAASGQSSPWRGFLFDLASTWTRTAINIDTINTVTGISSLSFRVLIDALQEKSSKEDEGLSTLRGMHCAEHVFVFQQSLHR
jgi:hypothetical protein